MANDPQNQDDLSQQTDEDQQTAIPYIPPPPPEPPQKNFRISITSGIIAAFVILVGGFMVFNYAGHHLTKISGSSTQITTTPTPSAVPTRTSQYP